MDREDGIACSFSVLPRFNVDIQGQRGRGAGALRIRVLSYSSSVSSCSSFQDTENSTDLDTDTETPTKVKCFLCDELFDTSEQSPKLPTGWQNCGLLGLQTSFALRSNREQSQSSFEASCKCFQVTLVQIEAQSTRTT